jgi:hypothetical protein
MKLRRWLAPTLLGPLTATWLFVAVTEAFRTPDPRRIWGFWALMGLGAIFAATVSGALAGWDLVLLDVTFP